MRADLDEATIRIKLELLLAACRDRIIACYSSGGVQVPIGLKRIKSLRCRSVSGATALVFLFSASSVMAKVPSKEPIAVAQRGEKPAKLVSIAAPKSGLSDAPQPPPLGTNQSSQTKTKTLGLQAGTESAPKDSRLKTWLKRPVGVHPELLDHGNVAPFVDIGMPFGYRVGVKVGLLDVLTLGTLFQWSPKENTFRIAPEIAIAFFRGRHLALGARYRFLFEPTPDPEAKVKAPEGDKKPLPPPLFSPQTHYAVATAALSRGYFSVGAEAGVMRRRALVTGEEKVDSYLFENRWVMASGMFVRAGTPRWGVSAQVIVPTPEVNLRFEWRFALFAVAKRRDALHVALREAKARRKRLRNNRRNDPNPP